MEEALHRVLVVACDDHHLVPGGEDAIEERQDRLLGVAVVELLELIEDDHRLLLDTLHRPHEALVREGSVDDDGRQSRGARDVLREEGLTGTLRAAEADTDLGALGPTLEGAEDPLCMALGLPVELGWERECGGLLEEVLTRQRMLADRVVTGREAIANVQPTIRCERPGVAVLEELHNFLACCVVNRLGYCIRRFRSLQSGPASPRQCARRARPTAPQYGFDRRHRSTTSDRRLPRDQGDR